MQIILDEKDKDIIEKTRNKEKGFYLSFVGEDSEKCSIEFTVNDPYKCNRFLQQLFHEHNDFLKEECGCEIKAISLLGVYSDLQKLGKEINEVLEEDGIGI